MSQSSRASRDPELMGLAALGFLAGEPGRLGRFLTLTGVAPEDLRRRAEEPALLGAVLDHLLADESLLFLFAEAEALHPGDVAAARRELPGAAALS